MELKLWEHFLTTESKEKVVYFILILLGSLEGRDPPPWLVGLVCHLSSLRALIWQTYLPAGCQIFTSAAALQAFAPALEARWHLSQPWRLKCTRTMIWGVRSSLVTVTPQAFATSLRDYLSSEIGERCLLHPTFGHKIETAPVTCMTPCGT